MWEKLLESLGRRWIGIFSLALSYSNENIIKKIWDDIGLTFGGSYRPKAIHW
jgi:hypothetical protein